MCVRVPTGVSYRCVFLFPVTHKDTGICDKPTCQVVDGALNGRFFPVRKSEMIDILKDSNYEATEFVHDYRIKHM